ncbi:MAG: sulfatase [Pirellulaceae bacterium]|nr:sulfatase [Pirellulaceae bacterium]
MLRISSPLLLVAVVAWFTVFQSKLSYAEQPKRPNVLFVLCDDLRWNALGCTGHPHIKTPHIDSLAKQGVLFENSFCTTSLCSPSRASILSGMYAHTHGVTNNFTEYSSDMASFPRQLQAAGYETAYIGKYHMGEENDEPRPGFDYFVTHRGQGKYFDTEFNINGQERKVVPGYYTTIVTDMAEQWLAERGSDKPWMLMIGQKAPHSFYFPEAKYEHAFDNVEVNYPHSAFQLADKPKWISDRLSTWHGIYGPLFDYRKKFPDTSAAGVLDFQKMVRAYMGTILSVDDSMGRLVKLLEQRGELDNTVVIFMGDNGLLEGEHGMVDKRTMHEASIRIPLIIRYPKLNGGRSKRVTEQVLTVDLAPTLCELAGVEPLPKVHGRSMVKMINQGDDQWRKAWFYHYNYEKQFPYTPNIRGIRTDRWKLIRYPHGDGGPQRHLSELYDLQADPLEARNLIDDPAQKLNIEQLSKQLNELMAATGITADKMPIDEGIKENLPDKAIR